MLITMLLLMLFCSQIGLLSYYYPKKITQRIDFVLSHYPADEYPKLYPVCPEKIIRIKNQYLWLNYLCIVIGIGLIINYGIIPEDYKTHLNVLDDIPLLYGMIQYLPIIFLEVLCYKQLKLMRELYQQSSRSAELQPRRLSDYISTSYIILAVVVYLSFIAFEFAINNFSFTQDFIIKLAAVTLANTLFIVMAAVNIYGKKRDPFQSVENRFKQTKFSIASFVFISIFMNLYLMMHSWVNIYQYNYAEIMINTLYFQIIALFMLTTLLNSFKVEEINFESYKKDQPTK
ncbi:hypothetical protein ACOYR1_04995 [Thalassotalea piscium]